MPENPVEPAKKPSVKLHFTVTETSPGAYLRTSDRPAAMPFGAPGNPGTLEFDGQLVTLKIGEKTKTWHVADEPFVDPLKACKLQGPFKVEGLDPETSADVLDDIAAYDKLVIHQGRLLLMPSARNWRDRFIHRITPSRIAPIDRRQDAIKANIQDWQHYENSKATLLGTVALQPLEHIFSQIMTPRAANNALRAITHLTRAGEKDSRSLTNLVTHLTTDDRASFRDGHGCAETLRTIISGGLTADTISGQQFSELYTFLEHTENDSARAQALLRPIVSDQFNQGRLETEFKHVINPAIKEGVLDKYVVAPLKEQLTRVLGETGKILDLQDLFEVVTNAEDAHAIGEGTQAIIEDGKLLRDLLDQYANAKAEKNIKKLREFHERLDRFSEINDDRADGQSIFHLLSAAIKNQIELDVAQLIINDESANKKLVERLKPIYERQQQLHNTTLERNTEGEIAALAEATREATQTDVELYQIEKAFKLLVDDLDELNNDPDLKHKIETIRTRAFGDGKDEKGAKERIEKAIEEGNLDAAKEAAGTIIQDAQQLKVNQDTINKLNDLQRAFNQQMRAWLTTHSNAPIAIKACWASMQKAFNAEREQVLTLIAQPNPDEAVIHARLVTMREKIPNTASTLHNGNTVATQWRATLTTAATTWRSTSLDDVVDGELLESVYPVSGVRATDGANPLNPLGIPALFAHTARMINLRAALYADRFNGTEHDGLADNTDGLMTQANAIATQLNELTDAVATVRDEASHRGINFRPIDTSLETLKDTAEKTFTSQANDPRQVILRYNFGQLANLEAGRPAEPNVLCAQWDALNRMSDKFKDRYNRLRRVVANKGAPDFAAIDNAGVDENAEFINTLGYIKELRTLSRAAMLLKHIHDYYPANHPKTTLHRQQLEAIVDAVVSGNYDFPHLKNNLDLLAYNVTYGCMRFVANKPSDERESAELAIKQYRRLINMLDILQVSPDTRARIQRELNFRIPNAPALFGDGGEAIDEAAIRQAVGWGLSNGSSLFFKKLKVATAAIETGGNLLAAGGRIPRGTPADQILEHHLPNFNAQLNWSAYQSLINFTKRLGLTDEAITEIQQQANAGVNFDGDQNRENYLTTDVAYADRASLNGQALNNALSIVVKQYHERQDSALKSTTVDIERLKFVARYAFDLSKDLERIASGSLSTYEADHLETIIKESGNQLNIISEAIALAQREMKVARSMDYQRRPLEKQQKSIQALKNVVTDLLEHQTNIQAQLDVVIENKLGLKNKGTPMMALSSVFTEGSAYKVASRAQQVYFDASKASTRQLQTLDGHHTAITSLSNSDVVSFTVTATNGNATICVPHKKLFVDGKRVSARSDHDSIAAHVDAVNRGLPVLENTRHAVITIQSSDMKNLFLQYYTLQHCAGKSDSQIAARYTGGAKSLTTLTKSWNLTELEEKAIEQISKKAPWTCMTSASQKTWASNELAKLKHAVHETHHALQDQLTTTTDMNCARQAQWLDEMRASQDQAGQTVVPRALN